MTFMKTSISEGCPERAIGNGTLLLVTGAKPILRFGTWGESFFSADCCAYGAFREVRVEGEALHVDCYAEAKPEDPMLYRSAVRMRFYADGGAPILVMGVLASHELTLYLHPEDGVEMVQLDRISSSYGGLPCWKWIAPSGCCLYGMADGEVTLHPDTMSLTFGLGQSRLLFLVPDETTEPDCLPKLFESVFPAPFLRRVPRDRLYKRARDRQENLFHYLSPCLPWREEQKETILFLRHELYTRQGREGGFFLRDGPIPLWEMCDLIPFLCADRNRRQAEAFFSFLIGLQQRYGKLPYACLADGSGGVFSESSSHSSHVAAVLALRCYVGMFGRPADTRLLSAAGEWMEQELSALRGGMMPFGENEDVLFPSLIRFHGSAEATLRFLASLKMVLSLGDSVLSLGQRYRLATAADWVVATFAKNFSAEGQWFFHAPAREMGIKRPHRQIGRCDACGCRGILRRKGTSYYDEACYDNAEETKPLADSVVFADERGDLRWLDTCLGTGCLPKPKMENLSELLQGSLEVLLWAAACFCWEPIPCKAVTQELTKRCCTEPNLPLSLRCRTMGIGLIMEKTANVFIGKK